MARVKLGQGEEVVEVWEKDPSTQAFTDLLNRALDKPREQVFDVNVGAQDELIKRLDEGRARVAAARAARQKS